MSSAAITVEGLGKRYRLDRERESYGRLTESLSAAIKAPVKRLRGASTRSPEWFWALSDINLDVNRGDVLGVIGRNGAGKSTLLKVLARITEPTTGSAELRGRVGSLLEVGTGFHPELTGRENIQLSAAILGMRRSDIARRFDEIVEFSGVGAFLDLPVKRYSSGMQVRLGFAVAAHLEPDIMLVDEVLAVGDAEFQRKCLGKMSEIGEGGRTIVFVSHNMHSVLRLCTKGILLDGGRLRAQGTSHDVVRAYLESDLGRSAERVWSDASRAPGDGIARLHRVRVLEPGGDVAEEHQIDRPIQVEVEYWSEEPGSLRPSVNLHFFNDEGVCLFVTNDWNDRASWERPRLRGHVRSICTIPGNYLAEGRISVTVAVSTYDPVAIHALERDAVAFQVVDRTAGAGVRGGYTADWPGVVRPMLDWRVELLGPPR